MAAKDFSEFVARQQVEETDVRIDWAKERDEWLTALDSLYKTVVGFLKEYIADRSIAYSLTPVTLIEDNIGEYAANRMDIKIGKKRVSLEPVGTLLIGSKGRVDVIGSSGKGLILLLNEKAKSPADLITVTVTVGKTPPPPAKKKGAISWAWKIVTNGPQKKFVDLDKDSFLSLLMEISNA
jgi:hypothetical protein